MDRVTGELTDVSTRTLVWNSLIFAGVAFVPLMALALLLVDVLRRMLASFRSPGLARPSPGMGGVLPDGLRQIIENATGKPRTPDDHRSTEDRLRELIRLRDHGLIDTSDYEFRKAEILSQL